MISSLLPAALACALMQTPTPSFDYDKSRPATLAPGSAAPVTVRQVTYEQLDGTRNAATLVTPALGEAAGRVEGRPAILFLHWYGPPQPTSNRTQFLPEAVELAGSGVVSLLVDTPWTRERWFGARDSAKDYEFSVQMAKDIRRALDVLLAQPGLDKTRIAVVGHDFGAMWGALAVASDPRVTHFAYAAGTPSFTDWYLYAPKREGADRDAFVAKLSPLDPLAFLPKIAPRPVLLQFGSKDPHVKNEAAAAQANATKEPKTVKIYEGAEHELTFQARLDRLAWIREQFKLPK
jgi:dienelactone hydrolase